MKNLKTNLGKEEENKEQGFARAPSWKRGDQKQDNQEVHKRVVVSNKFEVLEGCEEETL